MYMSSVIGVCFSFFALKNCNIMIVAIGVLASIPVFAFPLVKIVM